MVILVKNKKLILLYIVAFLFSVCIIYTFVYSLNYMKDKKSIEEQIETINEIVTIDEIPTNENTVIVENEIEPPTTNPYWDFINVNLLDVDLKNLKSKNNDTVGWIKVNGTNINYPFVQTTDNSYYLTHSFNKSFNYAGWVFLDYRNNPSLLNNKNSIIYAHGRVDKTMFGSLKNVLNDSWLNNSNNYIVRISNDYENSLWQVFSTYSTLKTNDYLKTNFNSSDEFVNFIDMLKVRSNHNYDIDVNENDRILTLSTCYTGKDDRVVLHAKLIKVEKKSN